MALPAPAPDRAALVTGASSGIGTEIARELARRGQNLILVARGEDKLRHLAAELSATGVRAEVLPADLIEASDRAELADRITDLDLTVEVLVNNAGFSTLGPVARADPAQEVRMLELDVVAVADLTTRFLRGMVERRRGAVLNVASTAAFQPLPGQAVYAAAKSFVLSYSQALRGELRGSGVTVTALCPGPVKTGFEAAAGFSEGAAEAALPKFLWVDAPDVARAAVEGMERGRMVVIPGAANRVSAALSQVTPRTVLLPLLAKGHPGLK
jgi:short-subunit dehydrogenase